MAWQTSLLAVRAPGATVESVAAKLGYELAGDTLPFEEATSSSAPGASFAQVGGWIVGAHPMFWYETGDPVDTLAELGVGSEALMVAAHGVSTTYSYVHQRDGKVLRRVTTQEYEPVQDEGAPTDVELAAERTMTDDPEDHVLGILFGVIGGYQAIEDAEFAITSSTTF